MKRIVILSMLLVMGLFATAQTVVLMSAAEACNRGYLDKARKLIDVACNNEETKNDAKTWYYAGLIYSKIGNDPQKSASAPDWCVVASNAIQKCIQLDKEGEYKKECKQINNDIKKYCETEEISLEHKYEEIFKSVFQAYGVKLERVPVRYYPSIDYYSGSLCVFKGIEGDCAEYTLIILKCGQPVVLGQ